jgi:hypothetical protein
MSDGDIFDFLDVTKSSEDSTEIKSTIEKKKYKLDLFNVILPALDKRDISFFKNFSPEDRKEFGNTAFRTLRYMSSTDDNDFDKDESFGAFFISAANRVNKNFWHPDLKKFFNTYGGPEEFAEFQCRVLATIGLGIRKRHPWIGSPKKKGGILYDIVRSVYPLISDKEVELFLDINTNEDIIKLVEEKGWQDEDIKKLKIELKKKR